MRAVQHWFINNERAAGDRNPAARRRATTFAYPLALTMLQTVTGAAWAEPANSVTASAAVTARSIRFTGPPALSLEISNVASGKGAHTAGRLGLSPLPAFNPQLGHRQVR